MIPTFTITPINNGTGIVLTNTMTGTVLVAGHSLVLDISGTINGIIASLVLSVDQIADYIAKIPITISAENLTAGKYLVLPDDFFSVQMSDVITGSLPELSQIMCIATYSYVQKSIHDKIVHTDRIVGLREKNLLHELMIHLRALEILGNNPPISMKDTVIARLTYLKTL